MDDPDFIVLGISGNGLTGGETFALVAQFRDQTGVTFPILRRDTSYFRYSNPDGAISPFPLDVISDKSGKIRYLRHEFDGEAMATEVERLLAESE